VTTREEEEVPRQELASAIKRKLLELKEKESEVSNVSKGKEEE